MTEQYMNQICCPLCRSNQIKIVESLSADRLNRAWARSYGILAGLNCTTLNYIVCEKCSLRFFDPAAAGDEKLYVQLQQNDWYYSTEKPEYEIARSMLPTSGRVLEVGSGKAAFAAHVGELQYTGLEFNDAAIARASEQGIRLIKQTIQAHAAAHTATYEAIVSFQVLEHVTDIYGFVAACVEALAPGGTLVLAVPDHEGLCGIAQNNILDMPPHHMSHWSASTLQHLAELFGLQTAKIVHEPVSAQHIEWAALAVEERALRRRLGLRNTLFDDSFAGRLVGKFAAFRSAGRPAPDGLDGHTILASYTKPPVPHIS